MERGKLPRWSCGSMRGRHFHWNASSTMLPSSRLPKSARLCCNHCGHFASRQPSPTSFFCASGHWRAPSTPPFLFQCWPVAKRPHDFYSKTVEIRSSQMITYVAYGAHNWTVVAIAWVIDNKQNIIILIVVRLVHDFTLVDAVGNFLCCFVEQFHHVFVNSETRLRNICDDFFQEPIGFQFHLVHLLEARSNWMSITNFWNNSQIIRKYLRWSWLQCDFCSSSFNAVFFLLRIDE